MGNAPSSSLSSTTKWQTLGDPKKSAINELGADELVGIWTKRNIVGDVVLAEGIATVRDWDKDVIQIWFHERIFYNEEEEQSIHHNLCTMRGTIIESGVFTRDFNSKTSIAFRWKSHAEKPQFFEVESPATLPTFQVSTSLHSPRGGKFHRLRIHGLIKNPKGNNNDDDELDAAVLEQNVDCLTRWLFWGIGNKSTMVVDSPLSGHNTQRFDVYFNHIKQ